MLDTFSTFNIILIDSGLEYIFQNSVMLKIIVIDVHICLKKTGELRDKLYMYIIVYLYD